MFIAPLISTQRRGSHENLSQLFELVRSHQSDSDHLTARPPKQTEKSLWVRQVRAFPTFLGYKACCWVIGFRWCLNSCMSCWIAFSTGVGVCITGWKWRREQWAYGTSQIKTAPTASLAQMERELVPTWGHAPQSRAPEIHPNWDQFSRGGRGAPKASPYDVTERHYSQKHHNIYHHMSQVRARLRVRTLVRASLPAN